MIYTSGSSFFTDARETYAHQKQFYDESIFMSLSLVKFSFRVTLEDRFIVYSRLDVCILLVEHSSRLLKLITVDLFFL